MNKLSICLISITTLLLVRCSNGPSLKSNNVPLELPVHIVEGTWFHCVIDEKDNVWQIQFSEDYSTYEVIKIELPDVHMAGINNRAGYGWAVLDNGKVYYWDLIQPSKILENKDLEKPVKFMLAEGWFEAFIFIDGTVWSSGKPSAINLTSPQYRNDEISYDKFTDMNDLVYYAGFLFGSDKNGRVLAAGSTGNKSKIFPDANQFDSNPIIASGLDNIQRLYYHSGYSYYYAIDGDNNIFYWTPRRPDSAPAKLEAKGSYINELIISNSSGVYHEIIPGKYNATPTVEKCKNPDLTEGYGYWQVDRSGKYFINLAVDGSLHLYNYNLRNRTYEKIEAIGSFKVRTDYFKRFN